MTDRILYNEKNKDELQCNVGDLGFVEDTRGLIDGLMGKLRDAHDGAGFEGLQASHLQVSGLLEQHFTDSVISQKGGMRDHDAMFDLDRRHSNGFA